MSGKAGVWGADHAAIRPWFYLILLVIALLPCFYLFVWLQYVRGQAQPAYLMLFSAYALVLVRGFAQLAPLPDLEGRLERMKIMGWALPALMLGYVAWQLLPSLSCGYLMTRDSIFHYIPATHLVAEDLGHLSLYGWIDFQGGMPLLLHYSPMSFWVFGAYHAATLGLVPDNWLWTQYQMLVVLGIASAVYAFMRVLGFTRLESLFSGLFATTWRTDALTDVSPYTIYSYWGLIPQAFSIIPIMLFLALFFRLMRKQTRRNAILAGLAFLIAFLSHGYFSLIALIAAGGYWAASVALHGGLRSKAAAAASVLLVAAAASLFYTVPYIASMDYVINSWNMFTGRQVLEAVYDFVNDTGGMSLDGKFDYLRVLGALGILSLRMARNREGKIFLLILALAPLVFIIHDVSLPLNAPIAYTHSNARGMAVFKLAWVLLGVVGAYELCESLRKAVKIPYLAAMILLLMVASDQHWMNEGVRYKFVCFSEGRMPGFDHAQGDYPDIMRMSEILKSRDPGRVMEGDVDQSLILYPLTGDGAYVDWPTDKQHMRLRYGANYLFDKLHAGDWGRTLLAMDKMGVRYAVSWTNKKAPMWESYQAMKASGNVSVLYERRMGLLELPDVSMAEVPGSVVALVDDKAFWEDTASWDMLMDEGGISPNTTYVLLRSDEVDAEAMDAFDTFVIGRVECGRAGLQGMIEGLRERGRRIYNLEGSQVCGRDAGVYSIGGNLTLTYAKNRYSGSVEELSRDQYGRSFKVESPVPGYVPLVIKDNYYPNWRITQGDELRKYFALPSNMLVFARPGEPVDAEYTTSFAEWFGLALSAMVLLALARVYISG